MVLNAMFLSACPDDRSHVGVEYYRENFWDNFCLENSYALLKQCFGHFRTCKSCSHDCYSFSVVFGEMLCQPLNVIHRPDGEYSLEVGSGDLYCAGPCAWCVSLPIVRDALCRGLLSPDCFYFSLLRVDACCFPAEAEVYPVKLLLE